MLDTVRHHLVADTPVGIFLSAGIDSNTIAALASVVGADLRTVTLAFEEYRGTPEDEAPLAEATAKFLGADHTTVYIGRDEFESVVDDFFDHMDQPSADGLNTYLVSRAAASLGLKVVLSGLGGDELFGGYPSFRQIPKLMRLGRFMPSGQMVGKWTERFVRALPSRSIQPKLSGLIRYSHGIENVYFLRRAMHLEADLEDLLDPSWYEPGLEMLRSDAGVKRLLSPVSNSSIHTQIAVLESCWYMQNQLLRDADWASMAHSLEVRVPFVDAHLLAELAPAIASDRPPTKRDLCACSGELSTFISERAKTGFTTPVRKWIATEEDKHVYGLRGWAGQVHRRFREAEDRESLPERAIA
jgi:asparagine synthase (glutamine-hydrolysing)